MSQCAISEIMMSPYSIAFLSESLQERPQQLIRILNLLCVLANEPNQRGLGLRLINSSRLAQSAGMIPSYEWGYFRKMSCQRISLIQVYPCSEAYLYDNDSLLYDITNSCLDQLHQYADTSSSSLINLDSNLANRPDGLANKIDINLRRVFLQLPEQSVHILLVRQSNHNLKLLHLDVGRVVIFAEENAHLVGKDIGTFLQEEIDVTKGDPLHLGR